MSGNKDALLDEKCAIVKKYMHLLAPEDRPSVVRFWVHMAGRHVAQRELQSAFYCFHIAAYLDARESVRQLWNHRQQIPHVLARD